MGLNTVYIIHVRYNVPDMNLLGMSSVHQSALIWMLKKQTTITEGKLSSFHKLQYRNMYHFFRGHLIINCYLSIFPSYFNLDVNIDLAIFFKIFV